MLFPKIAVGIVSYNCHDELERCLNSLKEFPLVIVVDGKWNDFEPDNIHGKSNDGTIELASSYPNTLVRLSPNQPEYVNRQKYIDTAAALHCEYLFWVDSDEWVEMPLGYEFFERGLEDLFKKHPEQFAARIHFFDKRFGGGCFQVRIIRHLNEMKHKDRHNQIWYKEKEVIGNYVKESPRGIIIHQEKNFRTKEREESMRCRNLANPIH